MVFAIGSLVSLVGVEIPILTQSSGLIPKDEFGPAGFLDAALPTSRLIVRSAVLIFLICVALLVRGARPAGHVGLMVGALGMIALLWHGAGAVVAMVGLFVVFLDDAGARMASHPDSKKIADGARSLARAPTVHWVVAAVEVVCIPALACAVVCAVEAATYTRATTGVLEGVDLWTFGAFAAGLGALAGARIGLELGLVFLLCRALVKYAGSAGVVVLSTAAGFYIYLRCLLGGYDAIGPAMGMVDGGWVLHVLFGAIALPMAIWTQLGLERLFADAPPTRPSQVARYLLASLLTPVGRPRVITAVVFTGLVIWGLCITSFPPYIDYAQVGVKAYAPAILLAAVSLALLLYLAAGRPFSGSRGALVLALICAALVAAAVTLSGRHQQRMVAHQYTEITWEAMRQVWLDTPLDLQPNGSQEKFEPQRELHFDASTGRGGVLDGPVIVILWDAARADHTTPYGYSRNTTPRLAQLANDSVVFETAYSSATATTVSLRHLFSGRYSSRYAPETEHDPFFPGAMVADGYTDLFVNICGTRLNGVAPDAFAAHHPNRAQVDHALRPFHEYYEPEKMARALALIDERRSDRFFMFLHLLAPHAPWHHRDESPDFGEEEADLYDESLGYADLWTGRFLDGLKERGLYEGATIVVTADHGVGLTEHGRLGTFQTYDEQLRVPLVLKVPGVSGRRSAIPAAGIDLAPTIMSMLRPGQANPYHGVSLAAAWRGQPVERRFLFHQHAFEDSFAVTDVIDRKRLHVHREAGYLMLYNLATDPGELNNRADHEAFDSLWRAATGWHHAGAGVWDKPWAYRQPPGR